MTIRIDIADHVAEVTLDRPEKLNAVDRKMVDGLHEALTAAEDAGVRALLLRAEGRAFSAGRDLDDAAPGAEDAEEILTESFNPLVLRLARFPAPSFAVVQGAALGVGLGLALACDVVFADDDAKLGSPFARIGAVLDSGAHHHFVHRLGSHRALELIYSGRLVGGAEATELGLVNGHGSLEDVLARARALARQVATGPTAAFVLSKALVRRIHDEGLGFEAVLQAEAVAQGAASRTRDYAEGISAFQEKRTPAFEGQ